MFGLALVILGACGGDGGTDANLPPTAPVVAISPENPSVVDNLLVEILEASTDPDGDPVTYTYVWSVDGQVRDDLVGSSVPWTATSEGETWQVEVIPSDPYQEGPAGSDEVVVTNQPPVVDLVVPDQVTTDEDVVATVTATDPEGAEVSIRVLWTLQGGKATYEGTTLPASETDVLQVWTVEAWVDDGGGEILGASDEVEVINRPPEITDLALSPDPYVEGTDVTALATVEEPDGEPTTVTYDFRVDGVSVQSGPDDTVPAALLKGGFELEVEAVASDGHEDSAPVTATLRIDVSEPVISSVSLSPSPVPDNKDLTASVSAYDPAGGWVALDFTWKVNGATVLTGNFPNLHSSFYDEGDTVEVTVVADNGVATSPPASAGPVTVGPAVVASTFDVWGFSFLETSLGIQGGVPADILLDASDPTSVVGATVVTRWYNQDYQLTYDLSDACDLELAIVGTLADTSWESSLVGGWWLDLVPTGRDLSAVAPGTYAGPCDSFDPALWLDYTPMFLFDGSYYTWAVGIAAPTSDFAASVRDLVDAGAGAYGDWATDWEPYLQGVWWAADDGFSLLVFELNFGFTYDAPGGVLDVGGAGTTFPHYDLTPLPFDGVTLDDGLHLDYAYYLLTFG